ncbi:MAG: hybrid sensor histidine kinase/response regulator [Magnetococcales bacterium]|nr:hybrid sensor histidine kinase/response regulator [Magnetococcales bacterium]
MNTARIIVIDDQPVIYQAIKKALVQINQPSDDLLDDEAALFGKAPLPRMHFEIDYANSGEEGLHRIREAVLENRQYAVAFIDMRMSGIDGLETARLAFTIDNSVQIIFCTAHSDRGWTEIAELGKADQWLILKKPFDQVEVLQMALMLADKWRLIRELVKAREKAEAANRSKSELFTNMSHELRTPNHVIGSYLGFALDAFGFENYEFENPSDAEVQAVFAQFVAEAENAARENRLAPFLTGRMGPIPRRLLKAFHANADLIELLNSVLDLAKLESGRMDFEFRSDNLYQLFGQVAKRYEGLLSARGLTIDVRVQDEQALVAEVDPGKMMRVFENLIGNAAKFSPNGSTLTVRFCAEEHEVSFSLSDTGPGIPESDCDAIFDKYFQSKRTASGAGGTGLGLPICMAYILAHHGRIWAENNPDRGSTFFVSVPRVQNGRKP